MVYVLNIQGEPIMPCKEAKARKLLKQNKAKIAKHEPFTIQLLFECENQVQDVSLGVDTGSKHIGISATTEKQVLYETDVELRNDIVSKLSSRREARRTRRNRLRYRPARFNNRVKSKHKGWLAPSIEQKINTHIQVIKHLHEVLPITKIIVETAQFDIQKINNPEIQGEEYQQGEQSGFWNVREYVLFRDNHECQHCHGRSKDNILNVHHIESRKIGGNAPNNLITLCETCHKAYHSGGIKLNFKRGKSYRDATFMWVMHKTLLNRLCKLYTNVYETYGYITKNDRIENNLPKEHYIDARCISGNPKAKPLDYYIYQKCVRKQNRQIHKNNFLKGSYKKNNQLNGNVFGFELFDTVKYKNKQYFVFGKRKSGFLDIRNLDGEKVNDGSISYKKLKRICNNKTILTERRTPIPDGKI
jgi:hypothetical protein